MHLKLIMTTYPPALKGEGLTPNNKPTLTEIEGNIEFNEEEWRKLAFVLLTASIAGPRTTTPREGPSLARSIVDEMVGVMPGRKERT